MNKKIIFICENKEKSMNEKEISELKDNVKLVYCVEVNSDSVELLTEQFMADNNIERKDLFKFAVANMRQNYPCSIISLKDFSKNHAAKISATDAENVYVLSCEKEDFAYSSSGLYYSADIIRQFSKEKGCDVFILPVTGAETYLCTSDIFSKKEIEDIMKDYSIADTEFLSREALVFADDKLINIKDYSEKAVTAKKKNKKI